MPSLEVIAADPLGKQKKVAINGVSAVNALPKSISKGFQNLCADYLGDAAAETIIRVARRTPTVKGNFPHHADAEGRYVYEPSWWWTSGFFPGSLWLLYERSLKTQSAVSSSELLSSALQWQVGMEKEQYNTKTHDLGFMILPAFYRDFQNRGSTASRDIVINAARSLSSRWSEKVGCLRSWDSHVSKRFNWVDTSKDYLVIIDNMMNLDLLYIGAELTGDQELARRATAHARLTLKHFIRPDNSTYHLINFDPETAAVKGRYTIQGEDDESAWTRGQAWALYGFATAYRYTGEQEFLDAAIRLSEYFCRRVNETPDDSEDAGAVYWDFDAPRPPALLDTSAAMIACSGMLLQYQLSGNTEFLPTVVKIMGHCARKARSPLDKDTILDHATVNSNKNAIEPVRDRGLVYADYYFLEVGNRLIDMGFKY